MSSFFDTSVLAERLPGIKAAVEAVQAGQLIVFPTDTVYGLGADAFSPVATEKIFSTKVRDKNLPLPVLVGSLDTIHGLAMHISPQIEKLIANFWPGGLSIILDRVPSVNLNLGNTKGKILLRMPLHSVAIEILRQVGPMAVTSANISGQPPVKDTEEAAIQFGDEVAVYLAGEIINPNIPSTIIDMSLELSQPKVIRQGTISVAEIAEVLELPSEQLLMETENK